MANLLSNTTIGGYQSIHTGNIGSYAITSIPTSFSSITVTSSFDTASADIYASMRVIRNNAGGADGMYIGYGNSGSGITRIFGGGSIGGALEKYATYTVEPGSFRAPIFYDSVDTSYYLDPNSTSYLYHLVLSGNSYFRPNSWIEFNGNYGLYWPSNYGLHIYPNAGGSHGALQINGTKGGWAGIYFNDSGNTLMANSNESGFHRQGNGWQFRWTEGTMYVHRGTNGGGTAHTVLDTGNYNSFSIPTKQYVWSRGENLLTNGTALLGNNTNFSSFTFDGSQAYFSSGSFRYTGQYNAPNTDELMPVNPEKRYRLDFWAKTANGQGAYYAYLNFFDVDGYAIVAPYHMYYANTLTTLAQTLNPGDTVAYLTSVANWENGGTAGVSTHIRSFIFWNYTNSFGYTYPPQTYSQNWYSDAWNPGAINSGNNTITLRVPWSGPSIAAGTKVSNGSAGGTYKYIALGYTIVPTTWTNYVGIMDGVDYSGSNAGGKFPPGTAAAKLGFLTDYNASGDTIYLANLFVGVDNDYPIYDRWTGNTRIEKSGAFYGTIFYDSNNGGYYLDPNSTSNLYRVDAAAQMRAPIFYDSQDTNYYLDPNGLSKLNHIQLNTNWSNGNPVEGAINIKGQYPSMTFRNTVSNNMWLRHMDGSGNIQHYFSPSGVDATDWSIKHTMQTDGTFYSASSMRAPIFYDSNDTTYYLDPNSNSYLSTLHVANATTGVSLHVGLGSTHGVYTADNNRKYLVVSASYYPHMALVATSSNNSNHGAVFSFVGSEGGAARQWNLGISNTDPFVFSIGYNRTGDNNPHYGIGDGWHGDDNHHARLSIDRSGNTKIRGMLYVNGTSGGISTGSAVIHAGNIGSQSVSYASTAGSLSSMNISQFTNNSGYLTGITSGQVTGALGYTPYNSSNPSGYITSGDTTTGIFTTFLGNATSNIGSGYTRVIRNENGAGGAPNYAPILHVAASDTMWQIAGAHAGQTTLVWRSGYSGAWNTPWWTIYHSGNFTDNSSNWNTAYSWGNHASAGYLYYRGLATGGNFQVYQSTPNTVRFDQINNTSNFSNAPGGYTYGGVLSLRGDNFGFQLWGSQGGDFYYKTQWNDDQYSGWRVVISSANIGSQSVSYASTAGNSTTTSQRSFDYIYATSYLESAGAVYGTIFYDNNDRNYYVDPNGMSKQVQLTNLGTYGSNAANARNHFVQYNAGNAGIAGGWIAAAFGDATAARVVIGQSSSITEAIIGSHNGNLTDWGALGYVATTHKFYAPSWTSAVQLEVNTNGVYAPAYRGNANVGGTGTASWHPDGIYCGSTMWQYGAQYKNNTGIYGVSEIQLNAGLYLQTYNDRNLIVKGNSSSDAGIEGRNAAGSNVFQIYGNGSDYGFLNGTWAAWDLKKTKNGALYMNNDNSYYLQTNSTSNFVALNIQGNAVVHAGNIGSQSVSNASTAGGLAVHSSRNNEANKIVRTDANGYIQAGWINTTSGAFSSTINKIYCSDDDYMRYQTPANFISNLGLITTSNIGSQSVSTATNLYGLGSIQSTSTGTSYSYNYQVRENAGGGSNTNEIYAPQLGFHWSGVVASSIMIETSGRMAIRNNPGTGYENFIAAVIYSSGYGDSTQWNTAYSWGNHASAGYQSASTAITTSNIGSQSVSFATTAGTANAVAWGNVSSKPSLLMYYQGFTLDANTMDGNSTGFTYSVNAPFTGPIARFSETGYSLQLNAAYSGGGTGIAFRTRNGDTGSFNTWRVLLNDSNYTSYAPSLTGSGASGSWGISVTGSAGSVAWTNVSSRPTALSQFTNDLGNYGGFLTSITAHTHAISDVTGLQTALDGKQAAGSYAASSHTHDDRYYTESESDTRFARKDTDAAISGNLVIGNGTYGNSTAYGSSGARLMFSGSDGDAQGNYYIGTNHNDYGGNYSKLELRWHTGIRMGAQPGYGGIRFYDTEDLGTVIFSVGTGDSHVRVVNNLYVGGNLALHAGNYNSYSPTLTGTGASGTWGINISGNAATVTNFSGTHSGSSSGTNTGDQTNISGNAATATNVAYSGLTGTVPTWNQNTTGNSATVGGYAVSGSVGANTVVIRDANNYIYAHYINSNVSETENPTINSFYTSNGDGWLRKSSVAHVKSQLGLGSMAYESSGTYQTVSGAINTGNIASQSVSYATISQQLTKFGDIYGQDWNSYFITAKLIVSNALGHTGANRPSDSYGYGTVLSYGETGGPLMQMYFPEDVGNTGGAYRALAYRSGYNGGWSPWKTVVNQVGNTCTVAGSNGTGLQVHSNVGYNQNPLTYFLLRGQADSSWKTFKILLTGDAGGQDIEFRRIAENNTDARMWYVPRGANQVIFDYTVVQPSDSRLKDNLTPITTPVDKIKSLRGVEFDWNSGEHVGTHDVGLIAQDVEAVLPEAVTTQEDGYKNLAYTKVIPLLVEAMKEQQTMIEALRAEIELLKNK